MKKERLATLQEEAAREAAPARRRGRSDRDSTARIRKTIPSRISATRRTPPTTREFFFELGNGDRRLLRDVVVRAAEASTTARSATASAAASHLREAPRGAALRAPLHRLPAAGRGRGADGRQLTRPSARSALPIGRRAMNASLRALLTLGRHARRAAARAAGGARGADDDPAGDATRMRRAPARPGDGGRRRRGAARSTATILQRWPRPR